MKKVLIILGPTGVGKSDMAIKIAQQFNGEIISADSVQIYRHLNIGSAKVTPEEMQGIPHHCIDILEPDQEFSVFEYVELTKKLINEITERGHLPIIVGGTGLYVKALTLGYDFGGSGKQSGIREKYEALAEKEGKEALYEKLRQIAPEMAEKIEPNNIRRVIRALEICESGEKPKMSKPDLDAKILALTRDRQELYEGINKRADRMLEAGLVEEVKGLLDMGIDPKCQSMQGICYKEVVPYIEGRMSKEDMVELIKKNTRNYAKRQLTFCRGIDGLEFVDVKDRKLAERQIIEKVEEWL